MKRLERQRADDRRAKALPFVLALLLLLAGCVMPDGTVYPLSPEGLLVPMHEAATEQAPLLPVAAESALIEEDDSPAQPYLEQGQAYLEIDDTEAAMAEYAKAAEADPNAAEAYLGIGQVYYDSGDYDSALTEVNKALEIDAGDPLAYYARGLIYVQMGDLESALIDLDQALALAPDDIDALALHAKVLWFLGNVEAAVTDYKRLLDFTNGGEGVERMDLEIAYFAQAVHHYGKGDLTQAAANVGQVLRINPWNTNLFGEYQSLSRIAEVFEEEMAIYERIAAEASSPGSPAYAEGMQHLLRARLLEIPEEFAAAVVNLSAAIEADPNLAAAYHGRGVAQMLDNRLLDPASITIDSEQAVYTDPQTGEVITQTRAEYDADREAEMEAARVARVLAIEDLGHALELDPTSAPIMYDLAVALYAQENHMFGMTMAEPDLSNRERVLDLFTRAVEAAPDWTQARLSRALVSLYWGRQDGFTYNAAANAEVYDLAYAPDGLRLVTARIGGIFELWDVQTGELLLAFTGHDQGVTDENVTTIAYSPDGKRLVTAGRDQRVRVWDAMTGGEVMLLEGHERPLEDALFSPDGARIASADNDIVRVWEAENGELLMELDGQGPIAFSPDGLQLVTGDSMPDLAVWNMETGDKLTTLSGPVGSSDGFNAGYRYYPQSVAFSPDGRHVATISSYGALRIWDVENDTTARVLREPDGDSGFISNPSVAYNSDGTLLITSLANARLYVWNVASGERVAVLGKDERQPLYSPTDTQIASVGPDGIVKLRDADSGDLLMTLKHGASPEAMALFAIATKLLETALADAQFLIDREAAEGWPYYVRATATRFLIDWSALEPGNEYQTQIDADWAEFEKLSPNVWFENAWYEAIAKVQFSGPVLSESESESPLMAGRIEQDEHGRWFVHDEAEFALQVPVQGPNGRISDIYVPDGPALVVMTDDFRRFEVVAMHIALGDLSVEEWFAAELEYLGVENFAFLDAVNTEYGETAITDLPDNGLTVAILLVGDRLFSFSYSSVGYEDAASFAENYGLQLEPAAEVLAELVGGLSLSMP